MRWWSKRRQSWSCYWIRHQGYLSFYSPENNIHFRVSFIWCDVSHILGLIRDLYTLIRSVTNFSNQMLLMNILDGWWRRIGLISIMISLISELLFHERGILGISNDISIYSRRRSFRISLIIISCHYISTTLIPSSIRHCKVLCLLFRSWHHMKLSHIEIQEVEDHILWFVKWYYDTFYQGKQDRICL